MQHYEPLSDQDKEYSWIKTVNGGQQVVVLDLDPTSASAEDPCRWFSTRFSDTCLEESRPLL